MLYNYNSSSVTSANWMYSGYEEWTITPNSSNSFYVYYVLAEGTLFSSSTSFWGNTGSGVRPTFYLNSNVNYISGDGTSQNPIRID